MKYLRNIHLVIFILTFLSIFSCKKKEEVVTYPSLTEFLNGKPELSIFNAAIDRGGLGDFRNGGGPFTWLIPNNDAFNALGITLDSIKKIPSGIASYLVNYHLINARLETKNMIAQNSFPRATQQGGSVFVGSLNAKEFFVNGSKIISGDNSVSNGLVHVLNRVNVPIQYVGNIQNILNGTGKHGLFIAALTKANRWAQLNTASVFSILAPTDSAMANAGLTSAIIASSTSARVDSIVRYHYFNSVRLFSNDLGNKQTPQTALGAGRTITSSNFGANLKGVNNTLPVSVTSADLLGTNGVVHVINGVLKY